MRTTEGLRRAKAQGVKLGRPSKIDADLVVDIVAMRTEAGMSAQKIADLLTETGEPTPGGGVAGTPWQASTIRRLLQREGVM